MNEKIANMSNHDYHAHEAISNSDMGDIHKSVKYWEYMKETGRSQTKQMLLGSMVHTLVLEPELFEATYTTDLKIVRTCHHATKKGKEETAAFKEEYAKFLENSRGLEIVEQEEMDVADHIASNYLKNDLAKSLLLKGKVEESYFWDDPKTGLRMKCRPDIYIEELGIVVDLKTCGQEIRLQNFRKVITQRMYDRQAQHYMNGIEQVTGKRPTAFVFAVMETNAPYDFAFYKIDEASLEVGQQLIDKAVNKLLAVREGGEKGLPKEIQDISIASWGFDVESR